MIPIEPNIHYIKKLTRNTQQVIKLIYPKKNKKKQTFYFSHLSHPIITSSHHPITPLSLAKTLAIFATSIGLPAMDITSLAVPKMLQTATRKPRKVTTFVSNNMRSRTLRCDTSWRRVVLGKMVGDGWRWEPTGRYGLQHEICVEDIYMSKLL